MFDALFPSTPSVETGLKARCVALMTRGDQAFEEENAVRPVTQAALWMPNPPLTIRVRPLPRPRTERSRADAGFPSRVFQWKPKLYRLADMAGYQPIWQSTIPA